jgi:orotate phosphoribosyltransferase
MSEIETQLLRLLKQRSFALGTFRLASGDSSSYYIDGRTTEVFSAGAHLIGEVLYEHSKDFELDAMGGPEVGAVPLTTAAVISYHLHGRSMEGFWVRNQVKGHGTQKLIEGKIQQGWRVAILDDVVTRGSSVVRAIQEVQRAGAEVVLVLCLVDRLCGAQQLIREQGRVNYRPVFTIRDFGVQVEASGPPPIPSG